MPTLHQRDQLAADGVWVSRVRAALVRHSVSKLLAANATAGELATARQIIASPQDWTTRFAVLIAAYGPNVLNGTGTDPAANTANGDTALETLVQTAWAKFVVEPEPAVP